MITAHNGFKFSWQGGNWSDPRYPYDGIGTGVLLGYGNRNIVATSGTGGSISSPGTTIVGWKNDKTYTMTPQPGYRVKDVKVDGVSQGQITSYKFTSVIADHTIHVDWEPLGYIAVKKQSADTSLSVTNRYALSGAQYTAYTTSACMTVAKDHYGNNIVLTTDANGNAKTGQIVAPGTYYLKETKASAGYRLDSTVHTVTVTAGNTTTFTSSEPPQRGYISLRKLSAAASWTQGNKCYSLAGAVYAVYRDDTQVATLTTDADGNTDTLTAPLGKYTVKEVTPSLGYRLDENTYSVDITVDNQTQKFESIENPLIDVYPLKLHKVDSDAFRTGHDDIAQGGTTLAGAKYSVKYYDGYYTSVLQTAPLTPKWEKTYTTDIDENGHATFVVPDADKFTDGIEQVGWPLGTYVIEETEAPFGYYLDEKAPYITQITKATATNAENNVSTGRCDNETDKLIAESNALLSIDEPKRADLMIMKYGEPSANPDENPNQKPGQAGVRFDIINNNDHDVYRVDKGTWAAKGEVVYTIATDEQGYATTQDIATVAGVRNALACGNYIVHEDPTSTYPGYAPMEDAELSVTTPERIYRWIIENKIGTPLKIVKQDTGTQKTVRGNASFEILNEAGNPIIMELPYPSGAVISVFTTSLDGTVILPEKLMPGNYQIREVKAPDGYTLSDELVPFTVDSSTVNTWDKPLELSYKNTPVKGVITVNNIDAETTNKIVNSSSVIEVYASEDIVTQDGTVRVKKGELVYTGTTAFGSFDTPELFLGKYHVIQKVAPDGYVLNTEEYDVELVFADDKTPVVHASVDVPNVPQKGKISIDLLDKETNQPILTPKGVFEIRAAEDIVTPDGTARHHKGDLIETVTADDKGRAVTEQEHYIGKYVIEQVEAPEGYVIDRTPFAADIVEGESGGTHAVTTRVEHKNIPQKGHIVIEKQDSETGNVVPETGAVFSITATTDIVTGDGTVRLHANEEAARIETDETGQAKTATPLYLGEYEIHEITAPYGYMNDHEQKTIATLAYAGQDVKLTDTAEHGVFFRNVPAKGSVEVSKIDAETKKPLLVEGISIDIVAAEDIVTPDGTMRFHKGDIITSIITDKDGIARAEELFIGKYAAVEKTAPDGYLVNPTPEPFEVEYKDGDNPPDTKKVIIEDTPVKGRISIEKTDTESGKLLTHDSASFMVAAAEDIVTADGTIRAHQGDVVEENLSTQDGKAMSGELYPGRYIVKETKAPHGYLLDETEHEVIISKNVENNNGNGSSGNTAQNIAVVTVADKVQKSKIIIEKIDGETENPLPRPGIIFDIIAKEDIVTPDGDVKHKAGDVVATVETDENGIAKTDELYIGKYNVVEKVPADKYMLNAEPYEVETKYDDGAGEMTEETLLHPGIMPRGNIEVEKLDGFDKQTTLEGAQFTLYADADIMSGDGVTVYYKAGDEIAKAVTDEDGKAIFEGMRLGKYKVVETKAPAGYLIAEDVEVELDYSWAEGLTEGDDDSNDDVDNESGDEDERVLSLPKSIETLVAGEDNVGSDDSANDGEDENENEGDVDEDANDVDTLVHEKVTIYDMPIQVSVTKVDEMNELLGECELELYAIGSKSSDAVTGNNDADTSDTNEPASDGAEEKTNAGDSVAIEDAVAGKTNDTTYKDNTEIKMIDGTSEKELLDSWTSSDTQSHLISAVPEGTYVLHEKKAKDGYELAEDITFEVKAEDAANGSIEIVMVDKKADVAAELVITDEPAPMEQIVEMVATGDSILLVVGGGIASMIVVGAVAVWRRQQK